jgi:hypothetical protein
MIRERIPVIFSLNVFLFLLLNIELIKEFKAFIFYQELITFHHPRRRVRQQRARLFIAAHSQL